MEAEEEACAINKRPNDLPSPQKEQRPVTRRCTSCAGMPAYGARAQERERERERERDLFLRIAVAGPVRTAAAALHEIVLCRADRPTFIHCLQICKYTFLLLPPPSPSSSPPLHEERRPVTRKCASCAGMPASCVGMPVVRGRERDGGREGGREGKNRPLNTCNARTYISAGE